MKFGEKVLWEHRQRGAHHEKLKARWAYVFFIGVRQQNDELFVIDLEATGIKHVCATRRAPEGERWQIDNLEWAKAIPVEHGDSAMPMPTVRFLCSTSSRARGQG